MRARIKQLFKRLLKTGGLFILIGIGVMIGFAIGVESSEGMQTAVTHSDSEYPGFESELESAIEQHIEERVEHRVVNGIGTVLASLGLIGLGTVMLVRSRRQAKEKSPESLK